MDVILAIAALCQNEVLEAQIFKERIAVQCQAYYSECIHKHMEHGAMDGMRECIILRNKPDTPDYYFQFSKEK